MQTGEIIEIDGKKFRVELHEVKVPTYEEALEVVKPIWWADEGGEPIIYQSPLIGNVPTERDALSVIAYRKLKVLEAYYNEGKQGEWGVWVQDGLLGCVCALRVFNLIDRGTANRFIEEQERLLKQFYQI